MPCWSHQSTSTSSWFVWCSWTPKGNSLCLPIFVVSQNHCKGFWRVFTSGLWWSYSRPWSTPKTCHPRCGETWCGLLNPMYWLPNHLSGRDHARSTYPDEHIGGQYIRMADFNASAVAEHVWNASQCGLEWGHCLEPTQEPIPQVYTILGSNPCH